MNDMTEVGSLWRRLLDVYSISVSDVERLQYGSTWSTYRETSSITDEVIAEACLCDRSEFWTEITLVSYGDYSGSILDHANFRDLKEGFAVETDESYSLSGSRAYIVLGELPPGETFDDQVQRLRDLVEIMEGLQDYPLINDETMSEIEMELADEAWDQYLGRDIESELSEFFEDDDPNEIEDPLDAGDKASNWFAENEESFREHYYSYEMNEWSGESATSVHNHRHDEAVRYAFRQVNQSVPV